MTTTDPVHQDSADGLWYFYDETWADRLGPYLNESTARAELAVYVTLLNEGPASLRK